MNKIRFQYFSDLHLERKIQLPIIHPVADYLILAGDIGHPETEMYNAFMHQVSKMFCRVFVVDGNHEWDTRKLPIQNRFGAFKNITLLEQQTIQIGHVTIAGTTLWTPYVNLQKYIQSIQFIHQVQLAQTVCYPTRNPGVRKPWICVTHHLPSYQLIHPKYEKYPRQTRFANHLDYLFAQKNAPNIWICGHSHCILQKQIANTDCRINTFGPTSSTFVEI